MSLLSDLLDFIRTRMPEGVSFTEVQDYLEITDKVEVRNLITDALDRNLIIKIGEKRGTRYLNRNGATLTDDDSDVSFNDNKAVETYLADPTPLCCTTILGIEKIIKFEKPKNLNEFIQNGRIITSYLLDWDYEKKKNVVIDTTKVVRMNYFTIKHNEKEPVIEKFDQINSKREELSFPSYEELREELRVLLHAKH